MALPNVRINIEGGQLGLVAPSADGVAGLVVAGVAASELGLGEPIKITSLAAAVSLGIDADYDSTNSLSVYRSIYQFYNQAGNGAVLWIMIVANNVVTSEIVDKANVDGAVKLLNAASGAVRLLAVSGTPTNIYSDELDGDTIIAINKAQILAEEYQANWKPVIVLLDGFNWQGNEGATKDVRQLDKKYVGVVLGSDVSTKTSFVGLVLGRLAAIGVQRSLGRVRDGDIGITKAYLTDGTDVEVAGSLNGLHDKGYIIPRKYVGKAGYYFNFGNNCAAATSDFSSIERVRTIEKARLLAYGVLLEELNDEVDLDASTGQLAGAYVKEIQGKIENAINLSMTNQGELSGVVCTIDETQNVLSTENLEVIIELVPKGVNKTITTTLRYTKSTD